MIAILKNIKIIPLFGGSPPGEAVPKENNN